MKSKNVIILIVYYILFCLSVWFPSYKNYFYLIITCINILFFMRRNERLLLIMSSICFSSELYQVFNLFLYLLFECSFNYFYDIKVKKGVFVCTLFLFSSTILNAIYNDCLPNAIIALCYYSAIWWLFHLVKDKYSIDNIVSLNRLFIFIQFSSTMLIGLKYKTFKPGDSFMGTFSDAHTLGIWSIASLILIICYTVRNKKIYLSDMIGILCLIFMVGLADAKAVVLGAFVGVVMYIIFKYIFPKQYQIAAYMIGIYILLAFALELVSFSPVKDIIKNLSHNIYIYNDDYNFKYRYFYETIFLQLRGLRFWIGYGLGQYGSRFANLFAYTVMYRNPSMINQLIASLFSPHYISEYVQYASLYSDSIVEEIRWRSAILTYPFSSLIAVVGENGVIGVGMLSYLINKYCKNSFLKVEVFFFITICIFDIYLDHINIIAFLLLLAGNSSNLGGKAGGKSKKRVSKYESNFSM